MRLANIYGIWNKRNFWRRRISIWKRMTSTSSMSWTKNLGQKTPSEAQKSSCVSAVSSNCFKHRNSHLPPNLTFGSHCQYAIGRPVRSWPEIYPAEIGGCAASPKAHGVQWPGCWLYSLSSKERSCASELEPAWSKLG